MTDWQTKARRLGAGFIFASLLALAGCGGDSSMGEVTGKVTVNGEIPMDGSSIRFIPSDGKSPTAGDTLKQGMYATKVPVGSNRVEIRVPRMLNKKATGPTVEGPGPGGPADIEESLPPEYHEKSTLTFDVKPGKNEKNWEITSKK